MNVFFIIYFRFPVPSFPGPTTRNKKHAPKINNPFSFQGVQKYIFLLSIPTIFLIKSKNNLHPLAHLNQNFSKNGRAKIHRSFGFAKGF